MGQAIRGGGDKGLEHELGVELDSGRLPAAGRVQGHESGPVPLGLCGNTEEFFELRFFGLLVVNLQASPHRRTNLVGQGVLDHGEIACLNPLEDEAVGYGQDEHAVGELDRLDSGQP
jgi:hypothetical protein